MSSGSQERHMRAGTENIASIVGMAHALKTNISSLSDTMERLRALEKCLLGLLGKVVCISFGMVDTTLSLET